MDTENQGGNRLGQVYLEKWPLKRCCIRTSVRISLSVNSIIPAKFDHENQPFECLNWSNFAHSYFSCKRRRQMALSGAVPGQIMTGVDAPVLRRVSSSARPL